MAKILLVEDNEYNRDMLVRRLERRGFQVVVAVDGGEGVAKALSEKPDLILMDMHLPVLDGWEATRKIRESDDTKTIPIIALTADAMAGSGQFQDVGPDRLAQRQDERGRDEQVLLRRHHERRSANR